MASGLLKALLQTANYFRNWRKSDPESATQRGRKYLFWILVGGIASLWFLYQYGIAVPVDFAMFTGGLLLVELFEFGTLLRIGMAMDPLIGGILGTIGLGTLTKFFRDLGGISAAINYFFSIR
ncbi:hypothetical protein [Halonotius sp. GCM10025705]|uniref:hypothetical protein n=1 Tax=Halonotius sp. GCM10025705 TaxID=3252678 RepID=UPI0036077727